MYTYIVLKILVGSLLHQVCNNGTMALLSSPHESSHAILFIVIATATVISNSVTTQHHMHIHINWYVLKCICSYIYTHMYTYTHTYIHILINALIQMLILILIHIYSYIHTHTYILIHILIHVLIHILIMTKACTQSLLSSSLSYVVDVYLHCSEDPCWLLAPPSM